MREEYKMAGVKWYGEVVFHCKTVRGDAPTSGNGGFASYSAEQPENANDNEIDGNDITQ
jgi:hypothetical protein